MPRKACCYGLTEFDFDEERDLQHYTVWLCDLAHEVPPFTPICCWQWGDHMGSSHWYAHEMLSIPTCKNWDWRMVDGVYYFALTETTPEEIPEREKIFRERIAPYIDDFAGEYNKLMAELAGHFDRLKQVDVEKAPLLDLLEHFEDYLTSNRRHWHIHMLCLICVNYIYTLFLSMCQELTGITQDTPVFQQLLGGFDSRLYRDDKETWHLSDRALELGLGELFQTKGDNEQIIQELDKSDAGKKWLHEYQQYLGVYGWKCEHMFEWGTPTWIEKPSLGIPAIKLAMSKGGAYALDKERERLIREREEAEKEVLGKVPSDQKEWFWKLMNASERAGWFSEDHTYYCDYPFHALGRRVTREYGKRFARAGIIDDPQDVYYLMPWEIRKAAIDMERVISLRPYLEPRKKEYNEYRQITPAPFYGRIDRIGEMAQKDAAIGVNISMPNVRPELQADLYGGASAPGVAEGIARVVMTEDKLSEVQPGEILVAPMTSAPWTPAFGVAAAVVVDGGGFLSHAVIVAREFGIPCVAGTIEGTKKIQTGQRIRVDGNLGAIYIVK